VDGIVEAMDRAPDLVICAGSALVDALALVTASHLNQQFLVVGAQLPEPTVNVAPRSGEARRPADERSRTRPRRSTRTRSRVGVWELPSEPASRAC
jgi:hypothetical protein